MKTKRDPFGKKKGITKLGWEWGQGVNGSGIWGGRAKYNYTYTFYTYLCSIYEYITYMKCHDEAYYYVY